MVLLESAHAIDSMGLRFFGQLLNDITDVKVMVILVGHDTLPRSIEEVEGTDSLLAHRVDLSPLNPLQFARWRMQCSTPWRTRSISF